MIQFAFRGSRREEALTSSAFKWSLLTSAATDA
jgi:hypothetical protein